MSSTESTVRRQGLMQALDRSRAEELDDLNREHRPDRHLSLVGAWTAGWLRPAKRVATEPLPPVGAGEVGVTYVGHASALLRWANLAVMVNPMLGGRIGYVRRAVQPGL